MADAAPNLDVLLSREAVAARVEALAARIAPDLDDDAVAVCLLVGGLWFAGDLTRALAALGRPTAFDALWLTSYGDGQTSGGRVGIRAGLQRPVTGREAARHLQEAGARRVSTAVFARKPWDQPRALIPDYVAWEAPARFLVGYGMDLGGAYRGLPYVAAVTQG
jgi:hypoxanthine phosphoribosyltransferase